MTRHTGDNGGPNLPVWIAPIAAAEAIDPLPLEVVGGVAVCVLFCEKAGQTLRNVWEDIMTDTVVLSEGTPKTDNNGNPLPEGAVKLKGKQGYRTQDGTRYIPLPVGQTGNHGETGHEISRDGGKYRNVRVDENGKIVPVPGAPGEWHTAR